MSLQTMPRPDADALQPAPRPVARRFRFRRSGSRERALGWTLTVVLTLVVLAPVVMVLYRGFVVSGPGEELQLGLQNWRDVFSVPGVNDALLNTVSITAIRVTIGMIAGVLIAWLITRTNLPGARFLEFGFWIAFFMPGLAVIQGWIFLFGGRTGVVNQWMADIPMLSGFQLNVYSYWGIIWVHLFSMNVTTIVVLLMPIFRNMDATLEEAAFASGATRWQMMTRVFLPLMKPVLLFLTVLGLIKAMQSYEVERVLGGPAKIDVYATILIRMVYSEPPFIEEGAALSSLVLVVLLPLVFLQRRFTRGQYNTLSSKMNTSKLKLGRWRWPAGIFVWVVVALLTLVPFIATLLGSLMKRWGYFSIPNPWTGDRWVEVLQNDSFRSALQSTLVYGLTAGVVGAAFMYAVAYCIVRIEFSGRATLDLASWLPWAVPGVLLSLGISSFILGVPVLRFLNGSSLVLIVALVLYAFPTGTQLLKTAIAQVNMELEEAASVAGVGKVRRQMRIMLPLLFPTISAAGLITFVAALSEVSGVLLLASTDTRTLALLSLDYLTGSNMEASAVINCILVLLAITVALISRLFGLRIGEGR